MQPPARAIPLLACVYCGAGLAAAGNTLRCPDGHAFDVARQGYVSMLRGDDAGAADTAAMVRARERFLEAGHLGPVTAALRDLAVALHPPEPAVVVDAGGGTGHHLRGVLDALADGGRAGVVLDRSAHAVRRAARQGPDVVAVRCDVWGPWPVATGAGTLALCVFAPRNAAEARRVLRPAGRLLVVTPTPRHLHEVAGPLGLLAVDEDKDERVSAQLSGRFAVDTERTVETRMTLDHAALADLVRMGPSAWHRSAGEIDERVAALPSPLDVTAAVRIRAYRPAPT